MSAPALQNTLRDPSLLQNIYVAAVGQAPSTGRDYFDVFDPASGEVIAHVANLDRDDARAMITSAEEAFSEWRARTAKERADSLLKWYDAIIANVDDLAAILTAEMGKPLAEARAEIIYGASFIQFFAEEAKRVYGETIPGHQRDKRITVLKQPIGVVGAITPWNFPNAMITRKAGAALAAGCTIVVKPADETPLSALALALLAERAGLPEGVFSVIPSQNADDIGKEFCENPTVRKLTFTGSTVVGKKLLRQAADTVTKCSMELGGNAPFVVFDDADLDKAVSGALTCKFRNNGQTCICANRIYVQSGVYEDFVEKFRLAVNSLKIGNGFSPDVTTGPLINEAAVGKLETLVADASEKGATLVEGGFRHDMRGFFFVPTVLTGITPDMRLAREEIFGPVASIVRFDSEESVIAQANDTEYGLASYIYSESLSRVIRVSEALEYGMVGVNTGIISTELAPFGGVKQSGFGREGSHYGIEDYLELKYVCLHVEGP